MTKNATAIIFAFVFLAAGVATLCLLVKYFGIDEPATTLTALLLIPLIAYGVFSGRISEFSAGGYAIKFAANQSVKVASTPLSDKNKFQAVAKAETHRIPYILLELEKGNPVAIMLRAGKRDLNGYPYYEFGAIYDYVLALRAVDPELIVVVVDDSSGKFIASIAGSAYLDLPTDIRAMFVGAVNEPNEPLLKRIRGFVTTSVTKRNTNADALRLMAQESTRTLVLVDKSEHPTAVVRRDDVVAEIVQALVAA